MTVKFLLAGNEDTGSGWHFETAQLGREHFVAVAVPRNIESRAALTFEYPTFQQLTSKLKARQPENRKWWERFSAQQK